MSDFFDDIRAAVRPDAGGADARLFGQPVFVQQRAGPLSGMRRRGQIKLEMNFLPPAFVRCETCGGCRFNRETLDIEYGGKNIAQVLDLSVEEAIEFFASFQKSNAPLEGVARHRAGLFEARPDQSDAQRRRSATRETRDSFADGIERSAWCEVSGVRQRRGRHL